MIVENKQGITLIQFEKQVQAFCPLGGDYYTAKIYVSMVPNEKIMDYCDTDKFIQGLGGEHLIIEDLVATVYDHIAQYEPLSLEVEAYAESNVHFPVTVTKASE